MLVSRFFVIPIQNNFSENVCAPPKPLSRVWDPSGVGGYMRKRVARTKVRAAAHSTLRRKLSRVRSLVIRCPVAFVGSGSSRLWLC